MLILINAFKSITRSKGRNILIGIIVLTIAVSTSIALAIRSAADAAKESGLAAQTITGTISLDRQALMESAQSDSSDSSTTDMRDLMSQYSSLSLDEMETYADSDYVTDFYYTGSASLDASGDLEAYSTSSSSDSSTSSDTTTAIPGGDMKSGGGMMTMGDFTVSGYSSESAMTAFISGESQISDGAMFDVTSADYQCLISSELALFNSLSVGDVITLTNPNNTDESYVLTIAGIYTNSSSTDSSQMMFGTANDSANLICVSYATLSDIETQSTSGATVTTDTSGNETTTALTLQTSGTYVFANTADYESFSTELTSKGLSEYYTLSSTDISSYEASLVPLENLSDFALTLLVIILAVGAVILVVINIFNIRERKYEIGVLTAIGIKKSKVAAQFVSELMIVTLIAIVIGTGIGAVASVPVSNSLLASQITAQETTASTQEQNFGRGGDMVLSGNGTTAVATSYLDSIDAAVDVKILGELIGIGIALTAVSSLAGIVFVLRYDPLKILSNRS